MDGKRAHEKRGKGRGEESQELANVRKGGVGEEFLNVIATLPPPLHLLISLLSSLRCFLRSFPSSFFFALAVSRYLASRLQLLAIMLFKTTISVTGLGAIEFAFPTAPPCVVRHLKKGKSSPWTLHGQCARGQVVTTFAPRHDFIANAIIYYQFASHSHVHIRFSDTARLSFAIPFDVRRANGKMSHTSP